MNLLKWRYCKTSLIIMLIVSYVIPAYGQKIGFNIIWEELISQARSYYREGKYSEAADKAKNALGHVEEAFGPGSPHLVLNLNFLAEIYCAQGKYVEAEPLYKQALIQVEKNLGSKNETYATLLSNLASVYYHQDRYSDAEYSYKRALEIMREINANNDNISTILRSMKELYKKMGKEDEVDKLEVMR